MVGLRSNRFLDYYGVALRSHRLLESTKGFLFVLIDY